MNHVSVLLFIVGLVVVAESATFRAKIDTSNGYCDTVYGKVKVGETFYGSGEDNCVRIGCGNGGYSGASCISMHAPPPCRKERGTGQYPNCCFHIVCPKQ